MAARRPFSWFTTLLVIAAVIGWQHWNKNGVANTDSLPTSQHTQVVPSTNLPTFLPPEARTTIALIQRGGPFPHRQDGSTFGNFERQLPPQPRGWYREYTVDTPGLNHRGARRIVTGGHPPREWFYTEDHYRSFRAFDAQGTPP